MEGAAARWLKAKWYKPRKCDSMEHDGLYGRYSGTRSGGGGGTLESKANQVTGGLNVVQRN